MRVPTEKGVEGSCLEPAGQELFRGVSEEATDVCTSEGEASDVLRENHGNRGGKVWPGGLVVAGPHGTHALGAGEEGAREDKRTFGGAGVAVEEGLVGRIDKGEAVEIV